MEKKSKTYLHNVAMFALDITIQLVGMGTENSMRDANVAKKELSFSYFCHTRFLRPKPDAHRIYAQDQVVIHTVRM
jgi:hypothetical protein